MRTQRVRGSGQSMVEMALLLPVFFFITVLFFQSIEIGREALQRQAQAFRSIREASLQGSPYAPQKLQPERRFKGIQLTRRTGYVDRREWTLGRSPQRVFHWTLSAFTLRFGAIYPGEFSTEGK